MTVTVHVSVSFRVLRARDLLRLPQMESFDLNKMEQQLAYPPPPPQIKDEAARWVKRVIFPSLIWGGGKSLFSVNSILLFLHERVAWRDVRVLKPVFISVR